MGSGAAPRPKRHAATVEMSCENRAKTDPTGGFAVVALGAVDAAACGTLVSWIGDTWKTGGDLTGHVADATARTGALGVGHGGAAFFAEAGG